MGERQGKVFKTKTVMVESVFDGRDLGAVALELV